MRIIIIMLLFISVKGFAGDGEYAISKIPAELLKNANAVKRFEEIKFEVSDIGKARLFHHYVITVLNENGDKYAELEEEYDKLHSIESIEGHLYDETGKKIRSLKKSDVQDLSGTSEASLAEDNRIKRHSFFYKVYPYTVEYEIETKFTNTLFYPEWVPVEDENYSVEYSRMIVSCPAEMTFRFKAFNFSSQPAITQEKNNKLYSWEIKNLTAIEKEYASPNWIEITPVVFTGPVQFKIQDYEGNMSSWADFGKFVYALKNGRDQLPDNIKQTVHQLTDGISDPRKKIETLYNFLQKNTRYVSIQLGIGGWQPFDAQYVANNRYGDCKALSNYMYSLLKEAGIKSYYTLAKAGINKRFFMTDFPYSQFNHVILCVPLPKDTMWLECTSSTLPAGYLGQFTSDRNVLLVDENGGKLIKTPKYGLHENLQVRKIVATISNEGNLVADVNTAYEAEQQDEVHELINALSKDKVMEYLKNEIDLPNYDVLKFDYKEEKSSLPVIKEFLSVTASDYAQVSGRRLFVSPNILSKTHRKLVAEENRKFDIDLGFEYKDVDSVEIKIPTGYQPESIPQEMKLVTKFGSYTTSSKFQDDKIIYYRTMEQYSGRFPAKSYDDMVKFYEQVYKADRSKFVFVKKDS